MAGYRGHRTEQPATGSPSPVRGGIQCADSIRPLDLRRDRLTSNTTPRDRLPSAVIGGCGVCTRAFLKRRGAPIEPDHGSPPTRPAPPQDPPDSLSDQLRRSLNSPMYPVPANNSTNAPVDPRGAPHSNPLPTAQAFAEKKDDQTKPKNRPGASASAVRRRKRTQNEPTSDPFPAERTHQSGVPIGYGPSASMVTGTDLNAGVLVSGSASRGTRMLASG